MMIGTWVECNGRIGPEVKRWQPKEELVRDVGQITAQCHAKLHELFLAGHCSWDLPDGPVQRGNDINVIALLRRLAGKCRPMVGCGGFLLFTSEENSLGPGTVFYEPNPSRAVLNYLRPGDVVVDAGANIGYYSVLASKAVGPEGKVLALEPDLDNLDLLTRNLAVNGCLNVEVYAVAAGDVSGEAWFTGTKGNGSIRLAPGSGSCRVPVRTIDELCAKLPRVNLLKVDTEGTDLRTLRGARETIRRQSHMALLLEFWPKGVREAGDSVEELLDLLYDEHGFSVHIVHEGHVATKPYFLPRLTHLPHKKNLRTIVKAFEKSAYIDMVNLWCVKSPCDVAWEALYAEEFGRITFPVACSDEAGTMSMSVLG